MCASVDTTDDEVNSRLMLNHRVDECIHKRAVIDRPTFFLCCRLMHRPASCVQLVQGTWTRLWITSRMDWTLIQPIK